MLQKQINLGKLRIASVRGERRGIITLLQKLRTTENRTAIRVWECFKCNSTDNKYLCNHVKGTDNLIKVSGE